MRWRRWTVLVDVGDEHHAEWSEEAHTFLTRFGAERHAERLRRFPDSRKCVITRASKDSYR